MAGTNYWSIDELEVGWQVCEATTLIKREHEGSRCGTVEWVGKGFADEDRVFIAEAAIRTYFAEKLKETGDAEEWNVEHALQSRLTPMVRLKLPDDSTFYWYTAAFRRVYPNEFRD